MTEDHERLPAPLIFGDASLARRRPDRWFRFVLFCFALQALPLPALILPRRRPPIRETIAGGLALSAACVICYPRSRRNPPPAE
jgi:hypothetical protein